MPVSDPQALIDDRVAAIRDFHRLTGQARAEIDVSGGVDSATLCALLARAVGPERVTAVFMGIQSSESARERARAVARSAGVRLVLDELGTHFEQRIKTMIERLVEAGYERAGIEARMEADPTILGSIRSCMRAPLGRGYNRLTGGGIRHGTGNECEDRYLRFYQKGGDGEVDTNPIAMLAKGEVFQLARALDVPRSVLEATPSPDLWGASATHTDEQELLSWTGVPWTYSWVSPGTGEYLAVGSIERVSRYLDDIDDALFDGEISIEALLHGKGHTPAIGHPAFSGLEPAEIEGFLRSAHCLERATRHKANPNVPCLGSRQSLVDAKILSNVLPTAAL